VATNIAERIYTQAEVERLICWLAGMENRGEEPETIELLATCHDFEYLLAWRKHFEEQRDRLRDSTNTVY
jgi:hypothetical protein